MKYRINANLVSTTEQLFDKATSAVKMSSRTGECFRTTVRVREGCYLYPSLSNIFLLERIMTDALEEYNRQVRGGGRKFTGLQFAEHKDALAEEQQELE